MQNKITYEKVKEDFGERGYDLISSEYKNTKTPLVYICRKHKNRGEQKIDYEHFKRKQGCIYCAYEQGRQVHQIPEDICREQVEENGYIYVGLERIKEQTFVNFICPKHKDKGIQKNAWVSFRLKRTSCSYCNGTKRSTEDFQKMVHEISPNINIIGEYTKARESVSCRCSIDGTEWTTKAYDLFAGYGCPTCGRKRISEKKRTTKEQKLEKLIKMRPDINVLSVPETSFGYARCECPKCGNVWSATYSNLTNPYLLTGCPKCKQSKGEKEVEKFLQKYNLKYESQKVFDDCRAIRPLPFDFYLPNNNILIEYDGRFHYEAVKLGSTDTKEMALRRLNETQAHDHLKTDYCLKNQIKLIRIPYWEKENIETILLKEIS